MNKEYTYIDGKVVVEDTEGNKRQIEYTDNLDEVLVEENRIELLEDKIKTLEEESSEYQKNSKSNKIYPWVVLSIFTFMPTICFKLIFPLMFNEIMLTTESKSFIGTMDFSSFASLFFTVYLAPLGILLSNTYFRRNKYDLKNEKGRQLALESLKEDLVFAKENLEKMKQDKTMVNKVEGFRTY